MRSLDPSHTHTKPRLIAGMLSVVVFVFTMPAAFAGQLGLGDPTISGDTVTVPIILQAEQSGEVSTLDFRVRYDPNQLRPVRAQAGPAAQNADKDVMSNLRGEGEYSVVLMGLNRNTISDGEVASVTFQRVGQGSSADVRITQTTFASPDALEIPSRGSSRTLNLDAAGTPSEQGQQPGQQTGDSSDTASQQPGEPGQTQTAQAQAGTPDSGVAGGAGAVIGPDGTPVQSPSGAAPGFGGVVGQPATEEGEESAATPGARGATEDAQRQLRDAIATADTARDGVDTPGSPATRSGTGTPGGPQGAQADETDAAETPQVVDARVQVAQARGAAEATPRTESRTGGQQPQGIPDTSGQPANMPLMIGATIALVMIGGLFLVRKKLFR